MKNLSSRTLAVGVLAGVIALFAATPSAFAGGGRGYVSVSYGGYCPPRTIVRYSYRPVYRARYYCPPPRYGYPTVYAYPRPYYAPRTYVRTGRYYRRGGYYNPYCR